MRVYKGNLDNLIIIMANFWFGEKKDNISETDSNELCWIKMYGYINNIGELDKDSYQKFIDYIINFMGKNKEKECYLIVDYTPIGQFYDILKQCKIKYNHFSFPSKTHTNLYYDKETKLYFLHIKEGYGDFVTKEDINNAIEV